MDSGELPSFINKGIEYPTREFLAEIINRDFKSHDLGSLCQLMELHKNHSNQTDENSVNAIIEYLKYLDVLYPVPKDSNLDSLKKDEYIFTQVGMRYCQATALAEALVSKYHNLKDDEIDVIVLNFKEKTSFAIEVKLSDKQIKNQRKHLTNEKLCTEIEGKSGLPIVNRSVIYLGENGESEDGVLYINAEDFLKQSKEMTVALLSHPNITEFRQLETILNDRMAKEVPEKKPGKKKKPKSR